MIANYEDVKRSADASFTAKAVKADSFGFNWHYNACFELTLILSGSGRRYVGDDISEFCAGDLVMIGPNVPHTWVSFDNRQACEAIVVHFNQTPAEISLFELPEMIKIKELLKSAARGIHFHGGHVRELSDMLTALTTCRNWEKLTTLITILGKLADHEGKRLLSARHSFGSLDRKSQDRFSKASEYLDANFTDPQISQSQIASQIYMSTSRFSQFFRQVSGRSYIEYLNELRIGHACKLLIETDHPITGIAFAAGFNNIANFNRHFLKLKNITPRQYRQEYITGRHSG